MDEPGRVRFLAPALRRHAEAGRAEPERLRHLPLRLFAGLWLTAIPLLGGLLTVLFAMVRP